MKLTCILVLVFLLCFNSSLLALLERSKTHSKASKAISKKVQKPKPIKTIKFGPKASASNPNVNSLGEEVEDGILLNEFPFKITRCDQIVLFASEYINDEDDYRVRRPGFVAISAHYTNLFEGGQDGQKLIQHVVHSVMKSEPFHLKGARGCIRVTGSKNEKNLNICVPSLNYAKNLKKVYRDFARCRLGDNLQPIPLDVLRELMRLCGITRQSLMGSTTDSLIALKQKLEAENTKKQEMSHGEKMLHRGDNVSDEHPTLTPATRRKLLAKMKELELKRKKKKRNPTFFIPTVFNNPWEKDRRRYVEYSKLKVPGSRR